MFMYNLSSNFEYSVLSNSDENKMSFNMNLIKKQILKCAKLAVGKCIFMSSQGRYCQKNNLGIQLEPGLHKNK